MAGFQTYSYSRHFLSACTRLLECETSPKGVEFNGWFLNVGIFPIGIDCDWLENERKEKGVVERVESLKKLFGDKKIIISRDKLDPIRGVKHKMIAFERFLEKFPEWRHKASFFPVLFTCFQSRPLTLKMVFGLFFWLVSPCRWCSSK